MEHSYEALKDFIVPLSVAACFEQARHEWKLVDIKLVEEAKRCPCGKKIKELCYIKNQLNNNLVYVGNVCVNKFVGVDVGNLFSGLKRIVKDLTANANEDLIMHAYHLGYIFDNEYHFLMNTKRKRSLSDKQFQWKQKINRRIIKAMFVSSTQTQAQVFENEQIADGIC